MKTHMWERQLAALVREERAGFEAGLWTVARTIGGRLASAPQPIPEWLGGGHVAWIDAEMGFHRWTQRVRVRIWGDATNLACGSSVTAHPLHDRAKA